MHDNFYHIRLFFACQSPAFRDVMPLLQAASTTAACGMLGDKDGRSAVAHRGLLAIVRYDSGSQSLGDNLSGMLADGRQTFLCDNLLVLLVQIKAASECRM